VHQTSEKKRALRGERALQLFAVLAAVWLALNGFDGWRVGLAAAATAAWLGAVLVPGKSYPWRPLRAVGFFLFFIVESVRGAVDVALRAFAPKLRVAPSFRRVKSELPPGQPLTLFVGVISLLPGTLSVDLREQRGEVVVHLLVPSGIDSVARLEQKVAWLFSLR
jgi:multicomponent Na+:H+ antiporter subunit E